MAEEGGDFNFGKFKAELESTEWVKGQSGPLKMRLQLLESFLDLSGRPNQPQPPLRGSNRKFRGAAHAKPGNTVWRFEKGSLTIVDLSCPFVDENDACALFNICLGIFLEGRGKEGRVVALDEAHKVRKLNLIAAG